MDWPTLIDELIQAGYSEGKIAQRVKTSQPTINRLKHGEQSTVRYDVGVELKKLHDQAKRKQRRAAQ